MESSTGVRARDSRLDFWSNVSSSSTGSGLDFLRDLVSSMNRSIKAEEEGVEYSTIHSLWNSPVNRTNTLKEVEKPLSGTRPKVSVKHSFNCTRDTQTRRPFQTRVRSFRIKNV